MMKKTIFCSLIVVLTSCLTVNTVSAQIQWTPEQKAIIETENTLSDLAVKGDLQNYFSYFDDNFQNWGPNSNIPVSKEVFRKSMEYYTSEGSKVDHHIMVPVNVWVNGNYAYIDYYDLWVYVNKEGKKRVVRGKNLDVLLKKGNRWVLVASMTQSDPQDN